MGKANYTFFRVAKIIVFFFLLIFSAFGETSYEVKFSLYDLYNNSEIYANRATIKAIYLKDGSSITFTFSELNRTVSPVIFSLKQGRWDFFITADDFSTPALDYQIIHSARVKGPLFQRLFLLEVGTIKGIVKDKGGKLVAGAKVKFECSRDNFIGEINTDLFGTFSTNIAPVGKCKVFAYYQDSVGMSEVEVKKGQVSEVEIYLNERVVRTPWYFYVFGLFGVVLAILLFLIFSRKKKGRNSVEEKNKSEDKKEGEGDSGEEKNYTHAVEVDSDGSVISEILDYSVREGKHALSKRSEDILNSLPEGERKIVEFIIEEGNSSSQARIHRIAKIPKSTLHRNLKALQQKNIIAIKKKNGRNLVYLTDYFLSER